MNVLHLAQTIAEVDETTSGKLIVGLPHLRHAKSLVTRRLSLNSMLQVSQSGSGDVPELRIDINPTYGAAAHFLVDDNLGHQSGLRTVCGTYRR